MHLTHMHACLQAADEARRVKQEAEAAKEAEELRAKLAE